MWISPLIAVDFWAFCRFSDDTRVGVFLNWAKALERGKAWDPSQSFCLQCSSSSKRQLQKDLNYQKDAMWLHVLIWQRTDICVEMRESGFCKRMMYSCLHLETCEIYLVSNFCLFSWNGEKMLVWVRYIAHFYSMEGLPQPYMSGFLLWFPSTAWLCVRLSNLFCSLPFSSSSQKIALSWRGTTLLWVPWLQYPEVKQRHKLCSIQTISHRSFFSPSMVNAVWQTSPWSLRYFLHYCYWNGNFL